MDWTDRVGSRLQLRDLHILLAVVEWGSMAKAARHLAVSQPVVSRAIADLERGMGVRLLDRTPQGVEPTIYGRALLHRGRAVFDELKGGVRDIKFLADPQSGELRIGSNRAIEGGLLTAILDRLSFQRPRVSFHVRLGDAAALHYHDLRERNVELIFGRIVESEGHEDAVNVEVLFKDRLRIVASIHNPWTRRRGITLKDLMQEPWTMPPRDSYAGSLIVDAFRASGLQVPHIAVAGYGIQLQTSLLATGRFLSALPESFLRFNGKQLGIKTLPVELPVPPRPIGIVTLRNRTPSPLASLFVECARTLSKPLAAMSMFGKP